MTRTYKFWIEPGGRFQPINHHETLQRFAAAFLKLSEVCDVEFIPEPEQRKAHLQFRFFPNSGMRIGNTAQNAFGFYDGGGKFRFNSERNFSSDPEKVIDSAIQHEFGHFLHLPHNSAADSIMHPGNSHWFMSVNDVLTFQNKLGVPRQKFIPLELQRAGRAGRELQAKLEDLQARRLMLIEIRNGLTDKGDRRRAQDAVLSNLADMRSTREQYAAACRDWFAIKSKWSTVPGVK